MEHIKIDAEAQRHLNAYIDYSYNVGENAAPFSEEAYGAYKSNQGKKAALRWVNSSGRTCKAVGPSSLCFCNHRQRDHDTLNPIDSESGKLVPCKAPGCKCRCFDYIPVHGSGDLKCLCKHSYEDHGVLTKKCRVCKKACPKFNCKWSCSCGQQLDQHQTVIESGKGAQGGIKSFMDLVDGSERYGARIEEMEEMRVFNPVIIGSWV